MIDPNGIAHIQLSVRNVERSKPFYYMLLHETFGMTVQYDAPEVFYCIGGRTGVMITRAAEQNRDHTFDQTRVGLHHFCFWLRSRDDIDELHRALVKFGAKIVHAPENGAWAPGYYSVLFEDPDGIRIEANFVPGRGNLDVIKDKPLSRPS
ncbi:MAG: VOC family protein [Alphaproteobacteria bacterium]|nr:VOC family protein [Alphaproteobacteria bacterium]